MRTFLDARAVEHGHRGIGAGCDDICAFVNLLGPRARLGFDSVGFGSLAREVLAMGLGWAEHIEPLDSAHFDEGHEIAVRHAARAQHAYGRGIRPRHIFDADAAIAAHPHMLQHPVIDEGQRLAGLDGGEQHQPAEQARPRAIFLLRSDAVICGFIDHIRLHPYGK